MSLASNPARRCRPGPHPSGSPAGWLDCLRCGRPLLRTFADARGVTYLELPGGLIVDQIAVTCGCGARRAWSSRLVEPSGAPSAPQSQV